METGLEEETYSKIIIAVIGILSILVIVVILDILTGGTLFSSLICAILYWIPYSGSVGAGYMDCASIPF